MTFSIQADGDDIRAVAVMILRGERTKVVWMVFPELVHVKYCLAFKDSVQILHQH